MRKIFFSGVYIISHNIMLLFEILMDISIYLTKYQNVQTINIVKCTYISSPQDDKKKKVFFIQTAMSGIKPFAFLYFPHFK